MGVPPPPDQNQINKYTNKMLLFHGIIHLVRKKNGSTAHPVSLVGLLHWKEVRRKEKRKLPTKTGFNSQNKEPILVMHMVIHEWSLICFVVSVHLVFFNNSNK